AARSNGRAREHCPATGDREEAATRPARSLRAACGSVVPIAGGNGAREAKYLLFSRAAAEGEFRSCSGGTASLRGSVRRRLRPARRRLSRKGYERPPGAWWRRRRV